MVPNLDTMMIVNAAMMFDEDSVHRFIIESMHWIWVHLDPDPTELLKIVGSEIGSKCWRSGSGSDELGTTEKVQITIVFENTVSSTWFRSWERLSVNCSATAATPQRVLGINIRTCYLLMRIISVNYQTVSKIHGDCHPFQL